MRLSGFARRRLVSHRLALLVALSVCSFAAPSPGDEPPAGKADGNVPGIGAPTKEDLADQRMIFMKKALAHYTVKLGDRKEQATVQDPCLRFTNGVSVVTDGVLAIYTFGGGRPAAVGQFFKIGPRNWVNEFTIIAERDVMITRSDRPFWKPSEYVCKLTDVPDSPVPAAKPALRLA